MSVTKEKVQDLTKEFGNKDNDTGATETQIAVITERIRNITSHLKNNKKDHSGRRGLVNLVSKRRKLLHYMRNNNGDNYKNILEFRKFYKNFRKIINFLENLENRIFFVGEYKTSLRTIYSIENTRIVELITSRLVRAPNFHFCAL